MEKKLLWWEGWLTEWAGWNTPLGNSSGTYNIKDVQTARLLGEAQGKINEALEILEGLEEKVVDFSI